MAMLQNGSLKKDENDYPVMGGTSSLDDSTIINSSFDPVTRRLLVDDSGSGSGQVLTPQGNVDSSNTIFTVSVGTIITSVVVDGLERYSGEGYTYVSATGVITIDPLAPPTEYIRVNTGTVGAAGQVNSIVAGTNITVNSSDPANPIVSATGGGSSGYQAVLSGGLTGTNTWTNSPNVLVIDNKPIQRVQTDTTIMWTISGSGPYTTVLTNAPIPTFDIFGI